ncbi:M23 family metallopeptidase [Galbitalea sp. SE-J8]|uniref:M23 family metallopeptidase n=1 Tax=Galbitalea sp. SE-J8 TaxID=3054952 RepID=UPI00259CB8F2|nr:M23 family metallopeptidase [Galbitalea sp. SE-J8]MDM4763915.1 M23 family metallopeptidase [Galbitalea sp. SE-J8]
MDSSRPRIRKALLITIALTVGLGVVVAPQAGTERAFAVAVQYQWPAGKDPDCSDSNHRFGIDYSGHFHTGDDWGYCGLDPSKEIAIADGVISETQENFHGPVGSRWCGNRVTIAHADGKYTTYCHMNSISKFSGTVARGERIGVPGGTNGTDTPYGTHVHISIASTLGNASNPIFGTPTGYNAEGQAYSPNLTNPAEWIRAHLGSVAPPPASRDIVKIWGDPAIPAWVTTDTGLDSNEDAYTSAVWMSGTNATLMIAENGALERVAHTTSGWVKDDTGVSLTGEISAVNMGGGTNPWVYVNTPNGNVYEIKHTTTGWTKHKLPNVSGVDHISAVNVGSATPVIMATSVTGELSEISYTPGDTWRQLSTGLVGYKRLSSIYVGGQWALTYAQGLSNSSLYEIRGVTGVGWVSNQVPGAASTGSISTTPSAPGVSPDWGQIVLDNSGDLVRVWVESGSWHVASFGVNSYRQMSAVYVSGNWPIVMGYQ